MNEYQNMPIGKCFVSFSNSEEIPVGAIFASINVYSRGNFYVYDPLLTMMALASCYVIRVPNENYNSVDEWGYRDTHRNTWQLFYPGEDS